MMGRPYTPVELTPGKYRLLSLAEISAGLTGVTPATPRQCKWEAYEPPHLDEGEALLIHLDYLRQIYGQHVHVLTKDMVRQFMGSLVYSLDYLSLDDRLPCSFTYRPHSKENLLSSLDPICLYEPPSPSIKWGQPVDCVTYYTMRFERTLDPYGKLHGYYPIDRLGIVMNGSGEDFPSPVFVFAEKLD
jgi:hypothetical protein